MINVPAEAFGFLLLLFAILVLWGLLSPIEALPIWTRTHDKWMHGTAFAGLAMLTNLWLREAPVGVIWIALVAAGLLGEVAQHYSVHRRFCWRDAVANAFGAAVGLTCIQWFFGFSDAQGFSP